MKRLTFEIDTEPYASSRDDEISNLAEKNGIEVIRKTSHTLYNPRDIVKVRPSFFPHPFPGISLGWRVCSIREVLLPVPSGMCQYLF